MSDMTRQHTPVWHWDMRYGVSSDESTAPLSLYSSKWDQLEGSGKRNILKVISLKRDDFPAWLEPELMYYSGPLTLERRLVPHLCEMKSGALYVSRAMIDVLKRL